MNEVGVETGVDRLVDFLKGKGKISLKDVAKSIKVPETTLQMWTEFLVEEQIIGLEYKFTKPYIFLNEKTSDSDRAKQDEEEQTSIETFKEEFFKNAKKKMIPENKIPELWKAHLKKAIEKQKSFFIREANKRFIDNSQRLFLSYEQKLLGR